MAAATDSTMIVTIGGRKYAFDSRPSLLTKVTISGTEYALEAVPALPINGLVKIWRLTKLVYDDFVNYHVAQHTNGRLTCDCMQSACRLINERQMELCKHRRVLRKLGLIESTLYEPEPVEPDLFGEMNP